ncbi:MAG: type I-MYXAN CRISPR-associated Cas8a1/Cmx1 [Sedimentisphaerales bacterium]|nr:type I-MYXAN CRISPR-associated Cas8a1/Cmx1 [Sedimentisphaerales bacterium]
MARTRSSVKSSCAAAPDTLTIRLYGPGMTMLHRAGLGGLACTLRYIEKAYREGKLCDDDVPGAPWSNVSPPWTVESGEVRLAFGSPQNASEFLRRLFTVGFGIEDGLIWLPGQYGNPPTRAVRAELQAGLTLTFLQHGRVRKLAKDPTVFQYDPNGDGARMTVEYKVCEGYKHQVGWQELCDRRGCVTAKPADVIGPLSPGTVVRHNAFAGQTKIEAGPEHILSLYFALVGCLALSVNRGSGVLIVPEVSDVKEFARLRPWMTPSSALECQISGASDAALQAQVRLRAKRLVQDNELPGCHVALFRPTPWASQQKSRVQVVYVPSADEHRLNQFEVAWLELPPRIIAKKTVETQGCGKTKEKVEKTEWFWGDSVVRSLVADNLARGHPWYRGFVDLMTKTDAATKKPIRNRLVFEKKGLHAMIEKIPWEDRGEAAVVRAVHEAIRCRYGRIADENKGNPAAMRNRWKGEFDRWRLAFSGAKTAEQFRRSLCDLFGRAGGNAVLREEWQGVLPMLDASRWALTRDLALLALASYAGKGAKDIDAADATENGEQKVHNTERENS